MNKIVLLWIWISFVAFAETEIPSDDIIHVIGKHNENRRSRQTGNSVVIQPEETTRFDSSSHIKKDSSILLPETGRISPSGFVVPKIRGQDVRLTDVYFEDILLQDPYSGLPLVEDLDIRAFGLMEIHQGVSPIDIPSLNPIGTIKYRFREIKKPSAALGLQFGKPYGSAQWIMGEHASENAENFNSQLRVYGRLHQTNGRYSYYNDNSTPYNTADDSLKNRENNDQNSKQIVPTYRLQKGPYTLKVIGWIYDAQRGLPSMSATIPSASREKVKGHLASFSVGRNFGEVALFDDLEFSVSGTNTLNKRSVKDPGRRFLITSEEGDYQTQAVQGGASIKGGNEFLSLKLNGDVSAANVKNKLDGANTVDFRRRAQSTYGGIAIYPIDLLSLELKYNHRVHKSNDDRRDEMAGASGIIAIGNAQYGLYAQIAKSRRLPSLVEEFGDGGAVRPNDELDAEKIQHKELGASISGEENTWRLGSAIYEDRTDDKIIFVPITANAVKALNIRKTKILGTDYRGEIRLNDTEVFMSYSRFWPYDYSRTEKTLIPGVPKHVVVGQIEQKIKNFTLRSLSRYRGEVYRDVSNTVLIPGIWIHDFSVDSIFRPRDFLTLQIGLAIKNVFDHKDAEISAPGSINEGRTAYGDVSGAPLPGRQWVLSTAASI